MIKNLSASSLGASFFARRARNEWLVMNRKGPWEGYSRPLSPSRLPLRAHFHQKRDVWVRDKVLLWVIIESVCIDSRGILSTPACDVHVRLKTNGTAIKIAKKTTNHQDRKFNSVRHLQRQQFLFTKTKWLRVKCFWKFRVMFKTCSCRFKF